MLGVEVAFFMQIVATESDDARLNQPARPGMCLVQSVITNDTGPSIRAGFPVRTPVVFRDLTLVYRFADGTRCAVPLYDKHSRRRTELEVEDFYLNSLGIPVRHPVHGILTEIALRGYFSVTLLRLGDADATESRVVTIGRDFQIEVKNPSTDTFLAIQATSPNGHRINVGTFSMVETESQVRGSGVD
jgi:hypothetical protein